MYPNGTFFVWAKFFPTQKGRFGDPTWRTARDLAISTLGSAVVTDLVVVSRSQLVDNRGSGGPGHLPLRRWGDDRPYLTGVVAPNFIAVGARRRRQIDFESSYEKADLQKKPTG